MSRMYRIIGGDGREYGPVSAAQVEQWIAQNRANARTQIKAEGTEAWSSLGELPEFATAFAARAATPPLPNTRPEATPAGAAPEPTAAPASQGTATEPALEQPDPVEAARACAGRSYRLSVFDTLSRGWDIVSTRPVLSVCGCTFAFLFSLLVASIPQIGGALAIVIPIVLVSGASWLLLRIDRGEEVRFADLFAGFSRAFRARSCSASSRASHCACSSCLPPPRCSGTCTATACSRRTSCNRSSSAAIPSAGWSPCSWPRACGPSSPRLPARSPCCRCC
jgi:hypothetical protein